MNNIRSTEAICRFYVMSFHDGYQLMGFDLVQNTEQLTNNLGRLLEAYH